MGPRVNHEHARNERVRGSSRSGRRPLRVGRTVNAMFLRGLLLFLVFLPTAWAQRASASPQPPVEDQQNETMIDTMKRMQIKREEQEHKKLLDKGAQIKTGAEELLKAAEGGKSLPRTVEKRLREIEKSARQIRTEFGGSGNDDEPLESPPTTMEDALKRLTDKSEQLNKELEKTSRRVISFTVIEISAEIAKLVKLLRGYLA